ncbi:MAG: exodeoxyribonuclease V subunit alpha [Desulforhopalus sp.]
MNESGHSLLDYHMATFLAKRSQLSGMDRERFREMVQSLSAALEAGHSCLEVHASDEMVLQSSPLVSDGADTPLVLRNHRLYLQRYFHYERRLAKQISRLATQNIATEQTLSLTENGGSPAGSEIDWQQEAARLALQKPLTIICGGPGTGKTTTVVRILVLLLQHVSPGYGIALAAPTGKAAMRLSESIGRSLGIMELPPDILSAIPRQAMTLHRLLGVRRNSPQFHHNGCNPMAWDIVVVDEASMVDLAMMSKLVDALKTGARLLLLGDKDQLASVESGAVLSDFIRALPGNTVELVKTYRFDSNIKSLAESINRGDIDAAWALLLDDRVPNVSTLETDFIAFIADRYRSYMSRVHRDGLMAPGEIFAVFNSFQVLCAVNYGNRGAMAINRLVELDLARQGFGCSPGSWYDGRPVLITRNDYSLNLYNGDIGICLADENRQMRVWFERPDGRLRGYAPYRLPSCETVFAMTIHKSQGSEFDEVLVVLPEEENRVLSRELVYTAVTRAKKSVMLVADNEVFAMALTRNISRMSGLAELLKQQAAEPN